MLARLMPTIPASPGGGASGSGNFQATKADGFMMGTQSTRGGALEWLAGKDDLAGAGAAITSSDRLAPNRTERPIPPSSGSGVRAQQKGEMLCRSGVHR